MSDLAREVITKMISGANVLEVSAAQALWTRTTGEAVTAADKAKADNAEKYANTVQKLVAAGVPLTDPAVVGLIEKANSAGANMDKFIARVLEMEQPKSGGLLG